MRRFVKNISVKISLKSKESCFMVLLLYLSILTMRHMNTRVEQAEMQCSSTGQSLITTQLH